MKLLKKIKSSVIVFSLIASMFGYSQTQNTRPNILFVFVDDLGYSDVGFNRDASFAPEYGIIPTPEMDELANNGIIAKNAHVVHPFCGPSRVALMTGMYPHRVGAQYNLPNSTETVEGVPVNETYFSKVLQDNNYNTAAIGKWHLGVSDPYIPNNRGFDYFFGMLGGGHQYFESDYEAQYYNSVANGNPVTNEYRVPLLRQNTYVDASEFDNDEYLTDILTEEAVGYINANASPTSDPFFMYLAYNAPHTPLQAPQAKIDQFKIDNPNFETLIASSPQILNAKIPNNWGGTPQQYREELAEDRLTYAVMVSIVDEGIGQLKNALTAKGVYDNTLIIFMSDNGGKRFQAGAVNVPLQQGKGSVEEGGHRVPMFFHWPDQITTPQTYDKLISSIDLYPTFVDLAGASLPTNKQIDGNAIMDDVLGGSSARDNECLYVMRPQNGFHNGAILTDQFKLSKKANGTWSLFDAVNDIEESTNLRNSNNVLGTGQTGVEIIDGLLDKAIVWVSDFQDVQPQWYDNDGNGSGHPHSFLWNNGTLPGYESLFERPLVTDVISVEAITNAVEGQTDGLFTVSLPGTAVATQNIDFTYTISGQAINGTDYTTISGTATILNGTNSTDINIVVGADDGISEGSETVIIQLNTTTLGSVDSTPVQITISDLEASISTELTAGDVAIVGWRAGSGNNGNGALAFMLLKDITAATKLSISNRSWSPTGWVGDYAIDDVWTWTAGADYSVGDVFVLDKDGLVKRVVGDAEIVAGTTSHDYTGKVSQSSDGDFDIATGGEGLLMYQVDPFVLPTNPNSDNWITGLNTNGGWGTGGGNTFCELPTALTNGVNANAVGTDQDNGVYVGALNGNVEQLRASINDSANWVFNETTNFNLWRFDAPLSGASGQIGVAGTLSVNRQVNSNYKIYPNPSKGNLTIQFNKTYTNVEIEFVSISGKSLKRMILNNVNNQKIDISNFPSGLYIVKIKSENNTSFEKIMKL